MNDTIRLLVQQISKQNQDIPEGVTKTRSKGKGRGKSTCLDPRPTTSGQADEIDRRSSIARISNTISGIFASQNQSNADTVSRSDVGDDDSFSHVSEESYPSANFPGASTTTTFWITKVQLDLNSTPVDQFESVQTEDQAIQDYLRLYNTNKQANSLFTCGLSYEEYLKGYFIAGFDLSTASDSSNPYGVPTVKSGHLRLKINFNKSAPTELTCLAFAEFPELLELGNGGKTVKSSFVPK
jgi:hypothetical protein